MGSIAIDFYAFMADYGTLFVGTLKFFFLLNRVYLFYKTPGLFLFSYELITFFLFHTQFYHASDIDAS